MSSLSSLALRIASRRLLTNATFADDRVFDSSIAPIDTMVADGEKQPFIIVSSEDEMAKITNRDVTGGERTIDLVFEISIAHKIKLEIEGEEVMEVTIPASDEGLELSLGLITRQLSRALFEGTGVWSSVFKSFVIEVKQITNRRGVGNKEGGRFAARQIVMTICPVHEPPFGHVPVEGEIWGDFIAAMRGDAELAGLASVIEQTITGTPIREWDRHRSDMGLTKEAGFVLGLNSPLGPDEEPVPLAGQTVRTTDG